MLLIEGSNIKKYFVDRLIIDIKSLKIYSEDRIGIVGENGVGKTTLLNILSQRLEPDQGEVKLYGKCSYLSQVGPPETKRISSKLALQFGVFSFWSESMSGGEKTRFKLAETLSQNSLLIFADEPTSNVDMEGIELMESRFQEYRGGLVVISHDRSFLDKLCNKIFEVERGKVNVYIGNYSDYSTQKAEERERTQFEYMQYVKEKKRLEGVIEDTKQKVKTVRKTPSRMGNSEARLHKMGDQKAKASLDRAAKSTESKIEHLQVKEKPVQQQTIKLDLADWNKLHAKVILEGKKINQIYGEKIIFRNADFKIKNGLKVALIGPNGCGKSTLLKMIMEKDNSIKIAHRAKIGYFSQDMSILDDNLSIIENVMEGSLYQETFARTLLARLLFKRESVYKKVGVLSGGERVKVSFAKILLKDINLLILDEPTNYMDINSLEVIEEALREYESTMLFVSHDRRLITNVANSIMTIESLKITMFEGNYEEYLARRIRPLNYDRDEIEKQIILLQHRLSEIVGRISMPTKKDDLVALDQDYHETLSKLKKLKDGLTTKS